MATLNDQDRQAIETAIFAGRRIEAIKLHRKATGSELVEAKRAVEDLEVDLRRSSPEKFIAGANKKGCAGALVCAALIVAGAVLFSFLILR
jgi:ribosomal protein L7/L12